MTDVADVVIVGGGIGGASLAFALAREGLGVTVLEAIHAFEKVSGVKLNYEIGPRRPGDIVAIYANNDKAKSKLGWDPARRLEEDAE